VRLATGLGAAALFATAQWPNAAAGLFALSCFLDHTDGELARLTGQSSSWGHYYDLACDALVTELLFLSIGIGLNGTGVGHWSLAAGLVAGIAVATIFHIRNLMERRYGKEQSRQPAFGAFEAEDVLYLLPLVTWMNGLAPFLQAAAIGAPLAAVLVLLQFRNADAKPRDP
jgi:phosphatidylglycerophosphate synthase